MGFTSKFRRRNQKVNKEVYAFIDSQNLNLGIQKLGWHLDWSKFREYLRTEYGATQAYMFIGYLAENEALYSQLKSQGYKIIHKPIVEHKDSGQDDDGYGEELSKLTRPPVKGNVDAELVLYAMKELPNYNKAVIVSGDGDFYCLVEYLVEVGKLKSLIAPNRHYSGLFKDFENYIVRLDKKRRELSYHTHYKSSSKRKHGSNNHRHSSRGDNHRVKHENNKK